MKKVLSLLVAYIFLQTQTWAIGGGPGGVTGGSTSLVGSYAGALLPSSDTTTDPTNPGTTQFNGLGLFTLSLPQTGLGTGQFVYFSEGKTFTGTITGLADPKKQTFVGLVKGQFDIIVDSFQVNDNVFGDFSVTSTVPGGFANGSVKAKFVSGGTPVAGSSTALRLEGEAKMEISELTTKTVTDNNGTPNDTTDDTTTQVATVTTTSSLTLIVDGFQQSATAGGTSGLTSTGG
jgi:hypothetical protein